MSSPWRQVWKRVFSVWPFHQVKNWVKNSFKVIADRCLFSTDTLWRCKRYKSSAVATRKTGFAICLRRIDGAYGAGAAVACLKVSTMSPSTRSSCLQSVQGEGLRVGLAACLMLVRSRFCTRATPPLHPLQGRDGLHEALARIPPRGEGCLP